MFKGFSGPLKRLSAILFLLQPHRPLTGPLCDRECDWDALPRPYLASPAQVGVLNRLVLNRLGGPTARWWCSAIELSIAGGH